LLLFSEGFLIKFDLILTNYSVFVHQDLIHINKLPFPLDKEFANLA